ncbi:MAG: ferrochelatase [Desulfuromonadales bacterium]|nr:ferrochelatase [Desulfuromonadales bacterium]
MSLKKAVLLLQMGGPDSIQAVRPFLLKLFKDRDIIKIGPALLQPLIARLIVNRRLARVENNYRQIGGKSPLREITEAQAEALQKALGEDYRCFVAMRYSEPSTNEALTAIKSEGITDITVVSLYPHYSRATTGSSINELKRGLKKFPKDWQIRTVVHFYNNPGYIAAIAENIEKGLSKFDSRGDVTILFSAHSLPQFFIDEGDPYLAHIKETVRLVMERFGDVKYRLAFQSRAGPVKWLEPSTDAMLKELGKENCKNLLVVPVSFVSDHIETLHEIDIEYAAEAKKHGIENFKRVESLNTMPKFIDCLADLVRTASDKG